MTKTFKKLTVIFCICAMLTVGIFGNLITNLRANAEDNPIDFSSSISAVTPYNGATVNVNSYEIDKFWSTENLDLDLLSELYEKTHEHSKLDVYLSKSKTDEGKQQVADMYSSLDEFYPVNNVLKWKDNLENVESYTVRVALDNKFTKTVQRNENAKKDEGVVLENPLIDTEYYWQVIANLSSGDKVYSSIFSFQTEGSVRTIKIEGVSNTRDIGGFNSEFGYVKQGLVYRSSRLETITESGKAAFNKLGIKSDLDLRGESEASSGVNKKDPLGLDSNYFVFTTPYYGEVELDNNYAQIGKIMAVFADKNNYPIDVHCAVGRDRTGTIIALLKALVGCDEMSIKKDYFTSTFSVTGMMSKVDIDGFRYNIGTIFTCLEKCSGSTLAEKAADYLINKCGMTQDQITAIRNIMVGAEGYEVETLKTSEDTNNYSNYAFVTYKQYGVKTQTVAVEKGQTLTQPDLAEGYAWYNGETLFDFSTEISEDIVLTAKKAETCTVTVCSVVDGTISTLTVEKGSVITAETLSSEGNTVTAIMDENGNVVESYTVNSSCVLNIFY